MTNTTEVFWSASGVSLHTEAWAVRSRTGNRFTPAAKRGENQQIPFRPGSRWAKKYRDERGLSLPMWMIPRNPDGTRDPDLTAAQVSDRNWLHLLSLFDTEDEFPLVKRWWGPTGEVLVAEAQAEMLEAPQRNDTGGGRVEFNVDLLLADPWFYSDVPAQDVDDVTEILGDRPTSRVTLTMGNGRVTFPDGNWIEYGGTGTAVIDCHECTAKKGSVYVNGQITRNPLFPDWCTLRPGPASLDGAGTIAYQAAWV